MATTSTTAVRLLLVVLAALVLFALIAYYQRHRGAAEGFNSALTPQPAGPLPSGDELTARRRLAPSDAHLAPPVPPPAGVESLSMEQFREAPGAACDGSSAAGASCLSPADRLKAEDLLPKDAGNSKWAQVNPAGQGDVQNRNFLTAGYHLGVDTQGNSLRNASHDLRSTPPNPRMRVSIWNQSDIEPDMNRRPLE